MAYLCSFFNHFYQCPVFGKLRPITCPDWLRTTLTVFAGKFCVNPYVACVYLPAHLGEINGQIDLNNRWKWCIAVLWLFHNGQGHVTIKKREYHNSITSYRPKILLYWIFMRKFRFCGFLFIF